MSDEAQLKAIIESQIKALQDRLKQLEGEEKSLKNDVDANRAELTAKNGEILETIDQIADAKSRLEQVKANDIRDNGFADNAKNFEIAKGLVSLLDQSGAALEQNNRMDEAVRMMQAQNQVVIEHNVDQQQLQAIENTSKETLSSQETIQQEAQKIPYELDKSMIEAYEQSHNTPELVKTDAQRNWEKDIAEKEQKIDNDYKKLSDAIEKNKLLLDVQKDDAKKFPDSEKKLEQLKPLEELIQKEEEKLKAKYNEAKTEINLEKEALKQAVEQARQQETAEKQSEEIERQRREMELQRELDRQRQIDEQNRNR